MTARFLFALALFPTLLVAAPQARPQKPPAPQAQPRGAPAPRPITAASVDEAVVLTNGWARIAEGQFAVAANAARTFLAAHPRSLPVLSLAIDATIAASGAMAALGQYEAWLGPRPLDEPLVVRRIAHAMLWEEGSQQQDVLARMEALHALVSDGDAAAARELAKAVSPADAAQSRAAAATGNARAVPSLIEELNSAGSPVTTINALGASGSPQAILPLEGLLKDDRIEVRAAAVEALGRIGSRDVVTQVKPLLSDHNVFVRTKAAEALLRLDDDSGLPMLQQMLQDPASSELRLSAAEALATRADSAWQSAVYQLLQDEDPVVRAGAAHLLATRDPDTARATLEALAGDENAAVRELAALKLGDVATNDLPGLRRMMRAQARSTRVKAAAGVLRLTS
jgi:HEAT repeat protein